LGTHDLLGHRLAYTDCFYQESCTVSFADIVRRRLTQLYQAPWLNAIRGTTLGHLVLGSTFSWTDMLAYTVGVATGATIEYFLALKSCGEHATPLD
jgi:hypothetical protein